MGAPWERRPVAARRFLIEVDLVCADDMGDESLAYSLTQLATAGLHGMVTAIRSVRLDGQLFQADGSQTDARSIRPPPDPRLSIALRQIEELSSMLRSMNVSERPVEAVA